MLFFQAVLLAGYIYAHLLATHLGHRAQVLVHLIVLIAGAVFLPVALPLDWQFDAAGAVSLQVLGLFAVAVAAPFFAISATAPLLQHWYARTGRDDASDPYFLYAASNIGSIAALLGYPLVIEPVAGARLTSLIWASGYGLFAVLLLVCARAVPWGMPPEPKPEAKARVPMLRWLGWVALAALPSSMMLSTTQLIATDIGSFPLLWVIPLSIYLLTFVIAFSRRRLMPDWVLKILLLGTLIPTVLIIAGDQLLALGWIGFSLLLAAFAFTALAFHTRLHRSRPEAAQLTTFYLAMSVGGVLGGIFNAILAPELFNDLHEAPLALIMAGLILLGAVNPLRDVVLGVAAVAVLVMGADVLAGADVEYGTLLWIAGLFAAAVLIAAHSRPLMFATFTAGCLAAGYVLIHQDTISQSRSYFGIYAVTDKTDEGLRHLIHGTTIHGKQRIDQLGQRPEPTSYYHRNGPISQVVDDIPDNRRVAVIGLGVGAMACHAKPGQTWTYFEIDPEVDRIARDPALFSYMDQCGREMPTVIGDARMQIALKNSAEPYDILLIDAFSSDAIPVHLLTLEALQMYLGRVTDDGVIAIHISNRFFDLEPALGRAAAALGLSARIKTRHPSDELPMAAGENRSTMMVMARNQVVLEQLTTKPLWTPVGDDGGAPWTDDHANLLGALKPFGE